MGSIQLSISVTGIDQILQSFNVIRIKRSTTGITGQYSLITADTPVAAELSATLPETYDVAGKTLQLIRDQHPQVNIQFTGLVPLTSAQVVSQINAAVGVPIALDDSGTLLLRSTVTGTISKILVVGGSAAPEFGWADNTKVIGKDAHITLQAGISNYTYLDHDGLAGYYYKAQFYSTSTLLESNDSSPFEGDVGTLVNSDTLSLVKVDLVDARGIAIPDQEISFYPEHDLLSVGGFQVALNRAPVTIKTNNAGHAEVSLVRGLRVKVVFEGTGVIRSIVIPDLPETDLLNVMSTAPDPFSIKTLPFPTAPRRTI